MRFASITGWGKCLPPAVLTNDDLSTFLDTSDEWIRPRTGIAERRISHVRTSEMSAVAGEHALSCAGITADQLDAVIVATCSPDTVLPNSASNVARIIGAKNAAAFDLNAACTGFIYTLSMATSMIRAGQMDRILVIGAERLSRLMDWSSRETAVLFGDGAGAVIIEASDEESGLISSHLGCDAEARDILALSGPGTQTERFTENDLGNFYTFSFEGQEIFKRAVKGMGGASEIALKQANLAPSDISLIVPHQANLRIIEFLAKRMGAAPEMVMVNVQKYGNTSAATVPIALCEALEEGRVQPGENVLIAGFGGGLTWGAGIIKWGPRVTPIATSDAELPECPVTALELLEEMIEGCRQKRAALAAKG